MITDSLFHTEKKPLKKMALLFTIPCAILPILIATSGLMSVPFSPLFFKYDFIIFTGLYCVYSYGLLLSWYLHRRPLPFLIFTLHLIALISYIFFSQAGWLGYAALISIMATSISNQYFRAGSFDCKECNTCNPAYGKK